jgi:hypothetical protein
VSIPFSMKRPVYSDRPSDVSHSAIADTISVPGGYRQHCMPKRRSRPYFLVVVRVGVECARYREKRPTHVSDLLRVVKR